MKSLRRLQKRGMAGCLAIVMVFLVAAGSLVPKETALAAGKTLIIHYGGRADENYEGWNLWVWEEGKDGQQVAFSGTDSFGQVAVYQSKGNPSKIGFIVRLGEWEEKDIGDDRFVSMEQEVEEIWITSGEEEIATEAPEGAETYDFSAIEEERLKIYEKEEALKLNVHYYRADETYTAEELEAIVWAGEDAGGTYPYTEKDQFGAVFHVGLLPQEEVKTASLQIFESGEADTVVREVDLSYANGNELDVYCVEGNPSVWYEEDKVNYNPVVADAYFGETTSKQIIFTLSQPIDTADETEGSKFSVTDENGESYPIVKVWSEKPKVEKTAYLIMKEPLDLSKTYTITREGFDGCEVSMRKVIGSTYFDEAYAYEGEDLGAAYTENSTKFRVWAPTALEVSLNLYEEGDGDNLIESIPMEADEKGTWVWEQQGDLKGVYYTYSIRTKESVNEAVDLYAKSTGVNGNRGLIFDLQDTDPEGFDQDKRPDFKNDTDAIVYELHIRDLSSDSSAGIENTGKFSGLTERGTVNGDGLPTGLDHILDLGVTHVQILPSYDYATVDETKLSDNQFNWGYDPKNYNVPEGSYSTDPYHGEVRVKEMKEMIQTLHENGLRVIMDVVYNHTFNTEESWFQKTVPDYYYRKNGDNYSNASGCGNETASERAMMRKYMVDSVVYWATEYHIDGFRFDLMGVHDTETMMAIREALNEVDPSIIIYGEGWTSGDAAIESSLQATKNHTYQMERVGAFSDDIRDSIKGNVFDALDTGFVNGKEGMEESIKFSVAGAVEHPQVALEAHEKSSNFWSGQPGQSINYVSCHDNLTLWDKLAISNAADSVEDREKMNRLASAIVFTSQGVPFFQAGEEMLRSKPSQTSSTGFDENSYCSPDSTNSIKWNEKGSVLDTYEYYKGLIAFRKAHGALRMTTAKEVQENLSFEEETEANVVAYTLKNSPNGETAEEIFVVFNGNNKAVEVSLPDGIWDVYVNAEKAGTKSLGTAEGSVTVEGISALVLAQGTVEEQKEGVSSAANEPTQEEGQTKGAVWAVMAVLVIIIAAVGIFFYVKKRNLR